MKQICFYHAGCPDGLGAAIATKRAWGNQAHYKPLGHNDVSSTSLVENATVVYADISPPNRMLRKLAAAADKIIILDHHLSSKKRFDADPELAEMLLEMGHEVYFDLTRSGAVLAWQYFHPKAPLPDLIRYIEDQDLWKWKLPQSREINAAIGSYPQQLDVWDELFDIDMVDLVREGTPLVRANESDIEKALKTAHPVYIGLDRIEAVNCTTNIRSSLGHALAVRARFDKPWGLVYRIAGKTVFVSIYSIGDLDISELATTLGGGGHPNAAGFHISLSTWIEKFLSVSS